MIDVDKLCRDARRRLHKAIERRVQVALGRAPSTANRSVGQMYGKRWIHKREPQ